MSNYEEFYAALLPLEKALKDSAGAIAKAQKNIAKNTATGNLTEAKKLAAGLSEGIERLRDSANALTAQLDNLDKFDATKGGYGLAEEELQNMSTLYDKINAVKASWQSLQDMATVKLFGSLTPTRPPA